VLEPVQLASTGVMCRNDEADPIGTAARNCLLVYLMAIGSMYRPPSSERISTTFPYTAAMR
jgi:hypothetical protein